MLYDMRVNYFELNKNMRFFVNNVVKLLFILLIFLVFLIFLNKCLKKWCNNSEGIKVLIFIFYKVGVGVGYRSLLMLFKIL